MPTNYRAALHFVYIITKESLTSFTEEDGFSKELKHQDKFNNIVAR